MRETYQGKIQALPPNGIFVFGSNTEGRHGLGSAEVARQLFGAIPGRTIGIQGRAYAIMTKNLHKSTVGTFPTIAKEDIRWQIRMLYLYAKENLHKKFYVAYSGVGPNLNGYTPKEMAEMFYDTVIPENIIFERDFSKLVFDEN